MQTVTLPLTCIPGICWGREKLFHHPLGFYFVTQAGLELPMQPGLAWSSQHSSRFSLWCAGIRSMSENSQLPEFYM